MNEYELSGIENIARGVCVVDGRILLCRGKGLSSTYLPGGHIEFGETGREALVREIREEMGLAATAGELLGVVENSFMQHGHRHCEINLVYDMKVEGLDAEKVASCEDWIGFEWRRLNELDEANLLPESIRPLCGKGKKEEEKVNGGLRRLNAAARLNCEDEGMRDEGEGAREEERGMREERGGRCEEEGETGDEESEIPLCEPSPFHSSTLPQSHSSIVPQQQPSPCLHVIATPIGNLGDLSPRAIEAFKGAAVIACEDTRRTWQLLSHFGIPRPEMVSYRQGNEERLTERLVADVKAGKQVALCSDGGYPAISDPGYRLIRACAQAGVAYEVIPGASAVNVALLMSGLSTSSFTFRGFPPRGPGALRNWFAEDADKEHTLICYESPFRVGATLEAAYDSLGDREAAVCVELTKVHERVSRGYLSDLVREYKGAKVKGEAAIVIAGANPKFRRERPNP